MLFGMQFNKHLDIPFQWRMFLRVYLSHGLLTFKQFRITNIKICDYVSFMGSTNVKFMIFDMQQYKD